MRRTPPTQKELENKLYFSWQISAVVGLTLLALCLGAFLFEVSTNERGIWDGFFGLFNKGNINYEHWMGGFSWGIALYVALQPFVMLFRDASGHYAWRNVVYASEAIHANGAAQSPAKGTFYLIWSYYNHGFPLIMLIVSLLTDWYGFYSFEGRPTGLLFLLSSIGDLIAALVLNYASIFGILQAAHMIEEGRVEERRQSVVHGNVGIKEISMPKPKLLLTARQSQTIPSSSTSGFKRVRTEDLEDVVTGEFRDPSATSPHSTGKRKNTGQATMFADMEDLMPNPAKRGV